VTKRKKTTHHLNRAKTRPFPLGASRRKRRDQLGELQGGHLEEEMNKEGYGLASRKEKRLKPIN